MKKHNLLKALGIVFLIVAFLTWIIPAGTYSSGTFTSGDYSPLGLLDLVRIPLSTLSNYAVYGILVLVIGGFYGVLNRTGAYTKLINKLSARYKGKEKKFAVITIVFFALLSSITGLNFVLLILVPLFIAVLLSLGFSKISTLMSTIGAILVGNVASIYGFNIVGYINYYFELDINNGIFTKVIFFIILVFLLAMYVLKHNMLAPKEKMISEVEDKTSKKHAKEESKKEARNSIPLLESEVREEKSYWPLLIVGGFMIIFLCVALYNWKYAINFEGFETLYETLVSIEIKDFPIVQNIIGSFNPLGYWTVSEISIVLIIACFIIGWLYSIKFNDLIDGFIKGAKEVLPAAFFVTIANIIMVVTFGSSTGASIFYTISDYILSIAESFNVVVVSLFTAIGSLFVNDFAYFVNYMATNLTTLYTDSAVYPLMGFILQTIHGLVMFLIPTSVLLVAGLSYLKVSYKEWIKYAWKYVLEAFLVCVLIFIIMFLFI